MEESEIKSKKKDLLVFLILKALLAIGLGMAFLLNPEGMVTSFSYLIGLALIIYGLIESIKGIKSRKEFAFSNLIIEDGIMNIIVGLILVFWPNLGPNLVMIILGVWIILGGVIQLFIANKYKDQVGGRNGRGILTIVLGAIILFNPSTSVNLFSMVVGALSLLYGIYLLYLIFNFGKKK